MYSKGDKLYVLGQKMAHLVMHDTYRHVTIARRKQGFYVSFIFIDHINDCAYVGNLSWMQYVETEDMYRKLIDMYWNKEVAVKDDTRVPLSMAVTEVERI